MKRFTTINNIEMIQCGDYNWEIIKDGDEEIFQMSITPKDTILDTIYLTFEKHILYVSCNQNNQPFRLKMGFNETPYFIKSLIEGENAKLYPIHHKDTVKIK